MGDKEEGGLVGYRIGQERKASESTRITFVTTGWLLQVLVTGTNEALAGAEAARGAGGATTTQLQLMQEADASGGLGNMSHIILDEVHERGIDTDLVCLVLKLAVVRSMAARVRALRLQQQLAAGKGTARSNLTLLATARALFARRIRLVLMSVSRPARWVVLQRICRNVPSLH